MNHNDDDYQDDEVSKSAVKRQMDRWQKIGERLTELNQSVWAELPISDVLRTALEENKRHKQHGARRRHLQYIGRLMRNEDIDAIQEKLDLMDPSSEVYGRRQRQFELWRTRLVNETDALNDYIEQYPDVDRQQLRNLIRNAQKEVGGENGHPGAAYKKLFQFIKGEAD